MSRKRKSLGLCSSEAPKSKACRALIGPPDCSALPEKSPVEAMTEAARWFADQGDDRSRPFIPLLREKFGLTTMQALQAAQMAHDLKFGDQP